MRFRQIISLWCLCLLVVMSGCMMPAKTKVTKDASLAEGVLKAQYKTTEKEGRDEVARLALARETVRTKINALLERLKGLV